MECIHYLDGLDRWAGNKAVVGSHLVEGTKLRAFGAVAVVAADISNERVVELAPGRRDAGGSAWSLMVVRKKRCPLCLRP